MKNSKVIYAVREATSADIPQINGLFVEMVNTMYQKDSARPYPYGYWEGRFLRDPNNTIFVAELQGKAVGFLTLVCHFEGDGFATVEDFAVTEPLRNKGIGTQLLHAAHRYARSLRLRKIFLFVEATNLPALTLCKRLGYEVFELQDNRVKMAKVP